MKPSRNTRQTGRELHGGRAWGGECIIMQSALQSRSGTDPILVLNLDS